MSDLFAQGVAYESAGNIPQARATYKVLLQTDPDNCSAHVNLGTIYYNDHKMDLAEQHYRAALYLDPNYSLAYFDLANVLDETNRTPEAIRAYRTAIRLSPDYADAHYNLALAYQHNAEPTKALPHWRRYVSLDKAGPWFEHAVQQIGRITKASPLILTHSTAKPKRTKRRAKLFLVKH